MLAHRGPMRKIIFSIALTLVSIVLPGCATSTTVSQYAGLPRNMLPKDHIEYEPNAPAQRSRSEMRETNRAAGLSLDEENARLVQLLKICRGCMDDAKSYGSAANLQHREAAISRPLRERLQ